METPLVRIGDLEIYEDQVSKIDWIFWCSVAEIVSAITVALVAVYIALHA